jgi:hypothetical protein
MYRENLQNNKYWTKPYMTKQDNIEHDKNVPKRDREIKIHYNIFEYRPPFIYPQFKKSGL